MGVPSGSLSPPLVFRSFLPDVGASVPTVRNGAKGILRSDTPKRDVVEPELACTLDKEDYGLSRSANEYMWLDEVDRLFM